MKQLLTIILAITMILNFGLAQEQATATVDATVLANLTLAKDYDVNFGNIPATGTPILNPKGTGHTDVGTQAVVGEFSVSGSASSQISVVYPATITLGDGISATMTFTTDLEGHADTQASAGDIASGTQVTLGASGYKFWLGGNLGTLSDQVTGTYASDAANGGGDFTLTIEYY